MEVELLWWAGCPSTGRALAEVREALGELGLGDTSVRMTEITTHEDAATATFAGSPTILVDGADVVPVDDEIGLSCRVYRRRDGRVSPTPDPEDLRDALRAARTNGGEPLMTLALGELAPEFSLPDTDGNERSPNGAAATVVVFTCNHCPYALAWQSRLDDAARDYAAREVRFLAINSNDSERYPRDSYEAMQARAASEDWPMPYLHDSSQEVARAYGAKTTPDVFVLDSERRLRYRGAPDSDYGDESQRASWLRDALDAVLAGAEPERAETAPVGCSIKWKP